MENKRDLVLKAFNNEKVDRVPVGFWWHFADEYNQFRGLYDEGVIQNNIDGHKKMYDELKPDFIKIMSDAFFGHPSVMENDVTTVEALRKIRSIGEESPWYDKQVEMVKEISEYFIDDVVALYNVFAPLNYIRLFTECYKEQPDLFVKLFKEDPEAMLNASCEIGKDLITLVKKLKAETRIDGVYYSVQAIQDKNEGINFHRKYVEPSDLQVLNEINKLWDNVILHICGYADYTNDLNFYLDYKAKVYNWAVNTEHVSLSEGKKMFNGACVLGGFDNNRGTLLDVGPEEKIEEYVEKIIEDNGKEGIIIGADCTIAPEIGHKRLEFVRATSKKFS